MRPLGDMQADASQAPIRPVVSPLPGALVPAAQAHPEAAHAATLVPQRGGAPGSGPTGVALPQPGEPSHAASQAASLAASANSLHRWKTAALVLGALVLVGGSIVGTVLFMRGRSTPPVVVVQSPGGPHEGGPGGPREHRRPFEPGPPPPFGPGRHPPPGDYPPPPPPPPPHQVVAAAGAEGSAMATPAVAKVPGDSAPSAEPRLISVKGTVMPVLFTQDKRAFVARVLKQGRSLKVVGPETAGGQREVLGTATALKAMPKKGGTVMHLDDAAAAASQELFVVLPDVVPASHIVGAAPAASPEPALEPATLEQPTPPTPVTPAAPRMLLGGVKKSSFLGLGAIDKGLTLRNMEDSFWWNCKATLAGQLQMRIKGAVPKKGELNLDRDGFKIRTDAPVVEKNQLHLQCDEGAATFPIQG